MPGAAPQGAGEHSAASTPPTPLAEQAASASTATARVPAPPTTVNGIYTLRFEFGSARLNLPASMAASLIEEARSAPLVLLRGRTDGSIDTPGDSRIARERAQAVRDYLIAAGVPGHRIRTTWQASGDHEADNGSAHGRDLNRRVEIEIYRALPVAMNPALALRL
ncbi:MAG: OmpA family protein [Burkholderiales bacterium]|nr:OmpA family protein [Burkholderiales bacterium]